MVIQVDFIEIAFNLYVVPVPMLKTEDQIKIHIKYLNHKHYF